MGQFRAATCPLCDTTDKPGKWTCAACTELVGVYRGLIKNLQAWHSLYEALEVPDVLLASNGIEYCLWDVDLFYETRSLLAPQMKTSIELCLFENLLERDAAVQMGLSASSPVLIYATIGLTHMLAAQGMSGKVLVSA